MKFGLVLSPTYGPETPASRQLAEQLQTALVAEDTGFHTVVLGQHFLGDSLRFLQPIPQLSHFAAHTSRIRLATGVVLLSLVNPVDIAEQVATLDVVSNGRAVFGVGLGYSEHEYGAFGVEKNQRVRRFTEAVSIVRQMWSGQPIVHDGTIFTLDAAAPAVQPIQQRVPIWVGAQAEPSVRRAGRLGESWYCAPFPTHDEVRTLTSIYREGLSQSSSTEPQELAIRRDLVIADTYDEALELAYRMSRARYETYQRWGLDRTSSTASSSTSFAALEREEIAARFILGPAEACVDQINQLRADTGMTEFVYKAHWQGYPHEESMRQLELFATDVMPRVEGATERDLL